MIHELFSDLPTFKGIRFHAGLNILLADKGPESTGLQTRNGAGKTSLVEMIHFLTGSSCKPDSMFRSEALSPWAFGMRFDVGGKPVTVTRSGPKQSAVFVDGDASAWPIPPTTERKTGRSVCSNENWKTVLAKMMFDLAESEDESSWRPTFRSLFAYFVRRERSGGFKSAFQQNDKQLVWDQQVALSFLLGLDWKIAQDWQSLREKERNLGELKKAMAEGAFGAIIEPVAVLRAGLAVAEDNMRKVKSSLATFRVLEQYHDLESEASRLTREMTVLADDNALDVRYLQELEAATAEEAPPAAGDLEQLWRDAGVALPESVRRRYEDVQQFHESVVRNRRAYLLTEVAATKTRVKERDDKKAVLDQRRAEIMTTLKSHGALEHFTGLQLEAARFEAQTEALRQRYDAADKLERGQVHLAAQRAQLLELLQQDHREQRETLDHAAVVFADISRRLYEQSGQLLIGAKENGPQFDIRIHAEQSRGINNMQIFCFDMTLARLCKERGIGPGFLVHDSHLFDGVDERQVGRALDVGAKLSEELGFQYIVTMNSDAVPRDLPTGFELARHVLPVRLTDATDTGGLFGMRFQ